MIRCHAAIVAVAVLTAAATAQTVTIPATANIYGAGHAAPPSSCVTPIGPGTLPVPVTVPAHRFWMEIRNVTGAVLYCDTCGPHNGADGAAGTFALGPLNGISGISADRFRFLEGVFLTPAEPADPAPAALMFDDFTFVALAPGVAQHFFVGDGLAGFGAGPVQRFIVPSGATRLFLGLSDGFTNCIGAYGDNSGSFTATVSFFCGADLGAQGGVPGPDGVLDNNDFVVFIDDFFSGNPAADVGHTGGSRGPDGFFNNNDFVVFIDLFFEGC
jgi:hypothetical protein